MMPTKTTHRVALIDIGNTRMKIGWVDLASGARETTALALEHNNLGQLVAWLDEQNIRPDRAIGVNVAGAHKAQAVERLFLNTFKAPIEWLSSPLQAADVLNRYTNPAQLGVDRWIAMVGLSQHAPDTTTPLLLASCGTATTLDTLCPVSRAASIPDILDAVRTTTACPDLGPVTPDIDLNSSSAAPDTIKWVYDGGLIFPGPGLMRSSLATNTAQLPEANGTTTAFPIDTHKAITSGIAAAQAGALIRQWLAGFERYGIAPQVYGTGGGWPAIQEEAQSLLAIMQAQNNFANQPIQYLASPILDGLARMASEATVQG